MIHQQRNQAKTLPSKRRLKQSKKRMTLKLLSQQLFIAGVFTLLMSGLGFSQSANTTKNLKEIIFEQDSLLYDALFNKLDRVYAKNIVTPDLEFYHDKGGLMFESADAFLSGFDRIWKRQEAGEKNWQRRELIEDSFEIYPLNNYGVMQVADHKFYETTPDGTEFLMDVAKVVHIWKNTEDGWKLARVVSYDHQHVDYDSFEINAELEHKIEALKEKYNVPTVGIGLINNGKITYSKVFGRQENGEKATDNTIFKVASITKPVVSTTVMKLVDLGLWDLDEPLHNYWIDPDIANDPKTKKLTTRLVLNMQSGLPNWRHLSDSGKLKFLFEPGEKVEYSGEGFEYLKESMEAKFNTPLEVIVKKALFDKQDMNNIRFWWDDNMDETLYAGNYNANGEKYETNKYKDALAAGNILATVNDYLKFGVHFLEGAGLSNPVYTEMTTPQSSLFRDMVMYGYGWMSLKLESGEKMIYHDGRDPGVRTIIQLFPNSKQGVVILTNGDDGDKLYYELLKELSPNTKSFVNTLDRAKELYMIEMKSKQNGSD